MRKPIAVLLFLFVSSLSAQPAIIGRIPPDPSISTTIGLIGSDAPSTQVNLSDPATAAFTATRATVMWTKACSGNVFKVVFLRPQPGLTGYILRTSRGPFSSVAGRNDVALTPPVPVQQGDVVGIVQLQPSATCGSVLMETHGQRGDGFTMRTTSDMSVNGSLGTTTLYGAGNVTAVAAYGDDPLLVRVLPVGGAAQGIGTFFRTSVQLANFGTVPISGKLVFHRQGTSGSDADPSLPFTLNGVQTLSLPDVVAAMGTSGLGSIDVMTNSAAAPIVSARIFSDAGAAGTSGFTEAALAPADALHFSNRGGLLIPADLVNYRMNVGFRTLEAGATLDIYVHNAAGALVNQRLDVSYPPNYFDQTSAGAFTGAATLPAGGMIVVQVTSGAAFVYGTVTDNRTQDSSMRMATGD